MHTQKRQYLFVPHFTNETSNWRPRWKRGKKLIVDKKQPLDSLSKEKCRLQE
jgi:hypothetical protein